MSSEQIEDVMSAISEMGVNIVENDDSEDEEEEKEVEEEEVDPLDDGGPRPAAAAHGQPARLAGDGGEERRAVGRTQRHCARRS